MGNFITDYTGEISTETAGLELIKMHWNSVLSTNKAKYMTMDISNMYLNTPLDRFEYMPMKLTEFLQEIIDEYNLNNLSQIQDIAFSVQHPITGKEMEWNEKTSYPIH